MFLTSSLLLISTSSIIIWHVHVLLLHCHQQAKPASQVPDSVLVLRCLLCRICSLRFIQTNVGWPLPIAKPLYRKHVRRKWEFTVLFSEAWLAMMFRSHNERETLYNMYFLIVFDGLMIYSTLPVMKTSIYYIYFIIYRLVFIWKFQINSRNCCIFAVPWLEFFGYGAYLWNVMWILDLARFTQQPLAPASWI